MKRKSTNGLAILAGGMAFVGTAQAIDVIIDGNFENTTGGGGDIVRNGGTANPGVGGGWTRFSTYLYSTEYANAGPANCGIQFLRPYAPYQSITQTVSLTASTPLTPTDIDGGQGRFTLSAWFSAYRTQGDFSDLTLEFLDAASAVVGSPVALGGSNFVFNIPTGPSPTGKYPDGKNWAQDSGNGTIPAGARTAQVIIASTGVGGGLPDGYVDLVSLDVTVSTDTAPALVQAFPANNAINVDPLANISVTLQDRATAVNTNSIQLSLDNVVVSPSIQKAGTNTTIQYAPGALAALSTHTYKIVFGDNGAPVTTKTNVFQFKVADYPTLPASQRTPLGSEDAAKPGFNVKVYQVETLTDPSAAQFNIEDDISFSEAVLAGLAGTNVADLTSAVGDTFAVTDVINWVNSSGAPANFPNDTGFPGIPGTSGSESSVIHEIATFVRFPTAGYYRLGVNNEDQFRLSAGSAGTLVLQISGPTNVAIPCVTMATNIIFVGFGGALPLAPLTAPIAYATPSGNPEDACNIATNTALAGKVVLLDRGGFDCNDAVKAKQAQLAGAVAVLMTTPGDPGFPDTGFPFRLGSADPTITIPVLVIAENYGAGLLKSYLTNSVAVSATIRADGNPRIAEWDSDKGFGAVNVIGGFAVPAAGVYPLRLVAGHMGAFGGAAARANLEWFSVKPDETKILVNDTTNPDSLRTFRARSTPTLPVLNAPTFSGGNVTLSWTGTGTLEEATAVTGPWTDSANQNNPQSVPATGAGKFYRIRQ